MPLLVTPEADGILESKVCSSSISSPSQPLELRASKPLKFRGIQIIVDRLQSGSSLPSLMLLISSNKQGEIVTQFHRHRLSVKCWLYCPFPAARLFIYASPNAVFRCLPLLSAVFRISGLPIPSSCRIKTASITCSKFPPKYRPQSLVFKVNGLLCSMPRCSLQRRGPVKPGLNLQDQKERSASKARESSLEEKAHEMTETKHDEQPSVVTTSHLLV
jgi:hypothetical protein